MRPPDGATSGISASLRQSYEHSEPAFFRDRLQQAMKRADRSRSMVALLFFDLNRFKQVNDTFDHFAGDQLLIEFANRVGGCLRDEDTLARNRRR